VATAWRGKGVADYAASTHRSRTRNSGKKSRNGVNAPGNSLALGIDQRSKPKPARRCWTRSADPPALQPRIVGHYRQLAECSVVYL